MHYMRIYNAVNKEKLKVYQLQYRIANAEKIKGYKKANLERYRDYVKAYNKDYVAANKDRLVENGASYRKSNQETIKNARAAYYVLNKNKVDAINRKWQKDNPAKRNVIAMRRKAKKLQAIPKWTNQFFISEIYDLANRRRKMTGIDWHVDHIVPLQHKLVCGLHCEANLRVIPATINRHKHNSWWPEMP